MISSQILGEFFHVVVVRRKLMTTSEASSVIVALSGGLQVASITHPLVADAIALHEHYQRRYWDALVVATAKHAGCVEVISEDMSDGQDYGGITVSNPFKP